MITITIDTKGLEAKIDKKKKDIAVTISNELNRFAILAVNDSKMYARSNVDEGNLWNKISFNPSTPETLKVSVVVAAFYAAYIEFGTGIYAAAYVPTLPQKWQEYARTFYVSGKGRTHEHPFLFPAIEINIEKLKDRLK